MIKQYAINAEWKTKSKRLCSKTSVGVLVLLHGCKKMWSPDQFVATRRCRCALWYQEVDVSVCEKISVKPETYDRRKSQDKSLAQWRSWIVVPENAAGGASWEDETYLSFSELETFISELNFQAAMALMFEVWCLMSEQKLGQRNVKLKAGPEEGQVIRVYCFTCSMYHD